MKGRRNKRQDCIVQWLTRSPDTREIPSSSLGIVIFPREVDALGVDYCFGVEGAFIVCQ